MALEVPQTVALLTLAAAERVPGAVESVEAAKAAGAAQRFKELSEVQLRTLRIFVPLPLLTVRTRFTNQT